MKISAMNIGFGAHVEEVGLTSLTQSNADLLHSALLEHGLLVIRDQKLSPLDQVRMSEIFFRLSMMAMRAACHQKIVFDCVESFAEGSHRSTPTPNSGWSSLGRQPLAAFLSLAPCWLARRTY